MLSHFHSLKGHRTDTTKRFVSLECLKDTWHTLQDFAVNIIHHFRFFYYIYYFYIIFQPKMIGIFIFVILSSIQSAVCTDIQLQQLENMVNNLNDTMLIVLKENVQYKKLVKNLEEKVLAQEESIRQLQEKCQLVNDSLLRDTEDPNFEKNHAIVEENDINVTSIMNENLHQINTRLGLDAGHGK